MADEAGIRRSAAKMNAKDFTPLFAGMLTQRWGLHAWSYICVNFDEVHGGWPGGTQHYGNQSEIDAAQLLVPLRLPYRPWSEVTSKSGHPNRLVVSRAC